VRLRVCHNLLIIAEVLLLKAGPKFAELRWRGSHVREVAADVADHHEKEGRAVHWHVERDLKY
jgi:hypothetical protein